MNAAIRNLTMIVATAAVAFVAQPSRAAGGDLQVVQFARVVITGKRLPATTTVAVVQLLRVVIAGTRAAVGPVAQLLRMVITGKRIPAEATLVAEKGQSVARVF